jgi:hypothetical protein
MPVLVLSTGHSVEIQNGIDAEPSTAFHDAVEKLKPIGIDFRQVVAIEEETMVKRNAETVEIAGRKELRILVGPEIVIEPVPEKVILLLAHNLQHGFLVLGFMPRITCNEVFHVEVTSSGSPTKHNWVSIL